jgi:hypothetical protein
VGKRCDFEASFKTEGELRQLNQAVAICLFRIAQESLRRQDVRSQVRSHPSRSDSPELVGHALVLRKARTVGSARLATARSIALGRGHRINCDGRQD